MTKEYLKMADVFPVEIYIDDESGNLIVDDDGIILESFAGDKIANYALHSINSHDKLVAEVERLREFERDALRYRFLLDNCTTQQADNHGPIFVMTIRQKDNPFNVGLSIDEAMKTSR